MNLRNRVNLIGNLGNDPEVKTVESGQKMAKFSLATSEPYKNKDGDKVDNTQWHNVTVWGKQVEFVEKYLKKGTEIALEGRLDYNQYEDKDGNKKYYTQIIPNDILVLKFRNSEKGGDLPF